MSSLLIHNLEKLFDSISRNNKASGVTAGFIVSSRFM